MADAILASSGIYKIANLANGKIYVGSAVQIGRRWRYHRSCLRRNKNRSIYLQAAWNKHGEDSFIFSVLEIVDDKSKLLEREQYWIDSLGASKKGIGYNISPTAGSTLGMKQTEETRRKVALTKIGVRPSAETLAKLSAAQKGRTVSPEHRAKISASLKGRVVPPEIRAKIAENSGTRGKKWTEDRAARFRATRIKSGITKLNDEAIKQIRSMCQVYGRMSEAARKFGVSVTSISRIVKRQAWAHVEDYAT